MFCSLSKSMQLLLRPARFYAHLCCFGSFQWHLSQDDAIRAVYWSTFLAVASITAVAAEPLCCCTAASAASHVCCSAFPSGRPEAGSSLLTSRWHLLPDQLIPSVLVSEHINLYHNHFAASDLPHCPSLDTYFSGWLLFLKCALVDAFVLF